MMKCSFVSSRLSCPQTLECLEMMRTTRVLDDGEKMGVVSWLSSSSSSRSAPGP